MNGAIDLVMFMNGIGCCATAKALLVLGHVHHATETPLWYQTCAMEAEI